MSATRTPTSLTGRPVVSNSSRSLSTASIRGLSSSVRLTRVFSLVWGSNPRNLI